MLAPNVDLKLVAEIQAVRRNWQLTPLLCMTVFQIIYMVIYNRSWIAERDIFHIGADRPECTTDPMLRLIPSRLGRFSAANYYKMLGTSKIMMSYKLNLATVDTLF